MVKSFITLAHGGKLVGIYNGILTLENVGTAVNYHSILITLGTDYSSSHNCI